VVGYVDVSVDLPTPKNNLHGLGFDPLKDAPEFAAFRLDGTSTLASNRDQLLRLMAWQKM
jgi:hypothetical protein